MHAMTLDRALLLSPLFILGCGRSGVDSGSQRDTEVGTDTDFTSDADTDTDTHREADSDGESDSDTDTDVDTDVDTDIPTDSERDTDVMDTDTHTDLDPGDRRWTHTYVEGNAGYGAALDVGPSGEVSVAYFTNASFADGECSELDHEPFPERHRFDLKLATANGNGDWTVETVDSPLHPSLPTGLDFTYTPDGKPAIAYTGGEPELDYCGANDAVYAVKTGDNWVYETAADLSGDAVTGDEVSDTGFGVGFFPALTFDPTGEPVVAYRDEHFVYLQRDDSFRADTEIAWRDGGSWNVEAVDIGNGAGAANEIVFDASDRPIVFTYNPEMTTRSTSGVMAHRRNDDGVWEQVRLYNGEISDGISAALDPVYGEPVVAFYSVLERGVKIRRLIDDDGFEDVGFWTNEIVGDSRYDEGYYPSLAFSPDGELALSYHRCSGYNLENSGCQGAEEGLVFAIQSAGEWYYYMAREGEGSSCGIRTSLAFSEDGTAHIAYQCIEVINGEHQLSLFVATRRF